MQPFYLRDADGVVLVRPDRAELQPISLFDDTCGRGDPLYYGKGPPGAVMHSDHRRRFVETGIPVQKEIYVMGQARERQDIVAPEIAHDPLAPMFLISVRGEKEIQSRHRFAFIGWNLAGLLLCLVGLAIWAQGGGAPVAGLLVGGGLLYALGATLGWLWMAYNSLVELRQRVRQAWSQVEVQLKRRHDLIPNLVEAVKALRDHERAVQTELAALRSQFDATPPGEAGPDYQGLEVSIRALAEKYPELKANEGFERLQKSLADTEHRIALARGYFNEIATHFNTRLETVPEQFVARLAGMKPRTLLHAQDFERVPVKVELQPAEPVPEAQCV